MLLAIILLIPLIVCIGNGEWGPAAVCIVLILLSLGLSRGFVKDARAYVNRRDYWARGGPDRDK